jgi:hypothetical protein
MQYVRFDETQCPRSEEGAEYYSRDAKASELVGVTIFVCRFATGILELWISTFMCRQEALRLVSFCYVLDRKQRSGYYGKLTASTLVGEMLHVMRARQQKFCLSRT